MKNLFWLLLPLFFTMFCASKGESSSESEPFFNFIRSIDPQNVLNITKDASASSKNPCKLIKLNGVRCDDDSKAAKIIEIRLENLNLSGTINVDSLCSLKNLRFLSLAKNNIRGSLPHSISHCTMLSYLNLSSNQLSGKVPKSLMKLKFLRQLDISNNKFFSETIQNQQEFKHLFVYSNNTGEMSPIPSTTTCKTRSRFKISTPLVLSLGAILLFFSLYLVGKKLGRLSPESGNGKPLMIFQIKSAPTTKITEEDEEEEMKLKKRDTELVFFVEEHERFTLEDLLQATADLRSENFSSSLYKVKLKNNVQYAVKRLKNLQVTSDEFSETLRKISKLKHPNILPIVGCHSTSEEKLIIYKYQSNGSLLNLFKGKLILGCSKTF